MWLHPPLSFCEVQGRYVFLDLARDRYFCLGGALDCAWRALLANAAKASEIEMLSARGLIAEDAKPAGEPCSTRIAQTSLLEGPSDYPTSLRRLLSLGWSVIKTRRRLRQKGLGAAVDALQRTKSKSRPRDHGDRTALAAIATDFARLDLLTTAHNRCLPRSLALAAFLARRGYWPELVLGVRLGPFRAHCWVECGNAVVNDRLERIRHYTPIRRL